MNGKSRLQQRQEEAEEVKDIMLNNLNKVDERSVKLGDLESRADDLLEKSRAFEKKTNQVKEAQWWKNKKTKIAIIAFGVVAILVILGLIIMAFAK
ncbi:vesicle-associated membrane protein 5 isoform X2 [Nerophis ophidion]|uniref:vesicle-associated membrane protein 5 isoform X2 n=1 Tax=Nerophis ophidion TaxID=159077 RepID=UPI002AE09B56|nr:vesicle-associated membrane protein 5 isoform X2 [Nerophis ophidion]